ncbi:hypothetical protein [Flavitalea flava]
MDFTSDGVGNPKWEEYIFGYDGKKTDDFGINQGWYDQHQIR